MKYLIWPFTALWKLLTAILELIGRILTFIFGCLILLLGALLTTSAIAAPVAIVFLIIGLLLIVRSIF